MLEDSFYKIQDIHLFSSKRYKSRRIIEDADKQDKKSQQMS